MPSASALLALVLGAAGTVLGDEHFCQSVAQADVLLQKDAVRTASSSQLSAPRAVSEYALDRGALDAMVVKSVAKEAPPARRASDAARAPLPPLQALAVRGASVDAPHGHGAEDPPDELPKEASSHGTGGAHEAEPAPTPEDASDVAGGHSQESAPEVGGGAVSEASTQAVAPSRLLSTAVRLELTIPKALGQIHAGEHGPLGRFLTNLKTELCQSVGIPAARLSVLGVRGEYMAFSMLELKKSGGAVLELLGTDMSGSGRNDPHSQSPEAGEGQDDAASEGGMRDLAAAAAAAASAAVKGSQGAVATEGRGAADGKGPESIVDLEILPGLSATEPSPHTVFLVMQRQLGTPDSRIMSGPLAALLGSSNIALPVRPTNTTTAIESERSGGVRGGLVRVIAVTLWYLACGMYFL